MKEILVGLPGPWAADNLETYDHYTTKIGGIPDWPFPESCIHPDLLQCSSCRTHLCLLAQVYAPTTIASLNIEERVLYIFGCTKPECGSWRAVRIQKPPNSEAAETRVSSASNPNWLDDLFSESDGDDGGDSDSMNLEELSRALSEATAGAATIHTSGSTGKNRSHLPSNPKKGQVNARVPVLPCFYIYTQEHTPPQKSKPGSSVHPINDSHDYTDNDDEKTEEVWEEEVYEYDKALNADRTYLKFKKQVDACPEQCFRYSFGGRALLATGQMSDPGSCSLCGEARHYEMQLMPSLVYFLQEGAAGEQKHLLDNWCWLTLMVYTCSKSCFRKADHDNNCNSNGSEWTVAEEMIIAQYE